MSFVFKFKFFLTVLVLFLLFVTTVFVYIIADMYTMHGELEGLTNQNAQLMSNNSAAINKTFFHISSIENLLDDPALPDNFAQLAMLNKFIDINNNEALKRVIKITDTTPLDLATASIIVGYSEKLDLPPSLLLALIEQESGFNQYSVGSHMDRGYCQVIPGTEKWLAQTYGHILDIDYDVSRIYEPEYNIGLGALYLYMLKESYGDNYHKILSEYNRGVFNLQKYYAQHGTYSTTYSRGILSREIKYKGVN